MRGKLSCFHLNSPAPRITPAGAGKTSSSGLLRAVCWDHPRRCGENIPNTKEKRHEIGSPPQVRGKLRDIRQQGFVLGITPAGAGKTQPYVHCLSSNRDHPRRCGENIIETQCKSFALGSPPQVRGKLWWGVRKAYKARITPAGAGKTGFTEVTGDDAKDHPRRCGENDLRLVRATYATGSPPQVRGKLRHFKPCDIVQGITPAGAGKTVFRRGWRLTVWDHPRRCGENRCQRQPIIEYIGSPPQVRGKQPSPGAVSYDIGITPAGAGKT